VVAADDLLSGHVQAAFGAWTSGEHDTYAQAAAPTPINSMGMQRTSKGAGNAYFDTSGTWTLKPLFSRTKWSTVL